MPSLNFNFQNASTVNGIPTRQQFRRWAKAALQIDTSVTIRIVDIEEGQQLNHRYRGKDYPTNVLTFALAEEPLMGDIVICAPVVVREADAQGKAILAHYAHLTVHGILHLHGYDHEVEAQAALMEAREVAILKQLGIANPYL